MTILKTTKRTSSLMQNNGLVDIVRSCPGSAKMENHKKTSGMPNAQQFDGWPTRYSDVQ